MLTPKFKLNKRENVNITNEISKLFKKRSIFDKNNYTVLGYKGNMIEVIDNKGKKKVRYRFIIKK